MIKTRSFQYQGQEYRLQAEIITCGEDLCILFSGGDRPHIGAVAFGALTGSANHPAKESVTSSLISVPGHKEGHLALSAVETLSKALKRTVVVTVGIHIEGISTDLIDRVLEEFNNLTGDVSESLINM